MVAFSSKLPKLATALLLTLLASTACAIPMDTPNPGPKTANMPDAPGKSGKQKAIRPVSMLGNWLEENKELMSMAPYVMGGSEGFVQYSFLAYMRKQMDIPLASISPEAEREKGVYANAREKVDWIFDVGGSTILIELKVESRSKEKGSFATHVKDDITKAKKVTQKAEVYAVAITYTPEAAASMKTIPMAKAAEVKIGKYTFTLWENEIEQGGSASDDENPFATSAGAGGKSTLSFQGGQGRQELSSEDEETRSSSPSAAGDSPTQNIRNKKAQSQSQPQQ